MDSGYTVGDTTELSLTRPVMLGTVRRGPVLPDPSFAERRTTLMRLRDHNPLLLRFVSTASTLVYAIVANSFFRVRDCVTIPGVPDRVMRSDTSVVCYQGGHLPVAVLAWVCLGTFLVAWPVLTFLYLLWVRVRNAGRMEFQFATLASPWSFYCGSDFRWEMFYFRHALLAVLFTLAYVVSHSLHSPLSSLIITLVVLALYLSALVAFKPYATKKSWKFPIHVAVVAVALCVAVLNYLLFVFVEDVTATRAARSPSVGVGVSWAVFGLIVAVFVLLVLSGWWCVSVCSAHSFFQCDPAAVLMYLFVCLFACLLVRCVNASQHTLNQRWLQLYSTPTGYVSSKLPSPLVC